MIVSAEDVSKCFADLEVLRSVSLHVGRGERVGLLGPSGCGKTTLLRILLGLETHDGGSVLSQLSRAGYLPQETLLLPWKTVLENLELPMQVAGSDRNRRRDAVAERLHRFGLTGFENAYPHELSGGMKQRAALLRAVLAGADSLVLDEPFGALDTLTRHRLQAWMADLMRELARTLVFVTHDLEEAIFLSHRVIVFTERPARVLGERVIDLTPSEKAARLGPAFAHARDDVMHLVLKGEETDA
jgi:ABC-type nitrate/sulfonate/bicarbonate transport system ATPase subunit